MRGLLAYMSPFKRLLAGFALIGFAVSLAVHVSACLGVNVSRYFPMVWLLHLGIFVIIAPLAIEAHSHSGRADTDEGEYYWWQFFPTLPRWLRYVSYALLSYVAVNFALFALLGRAGTAEEVDGRYILRSKEHGTEVTRELTEGEFDSRRAEMLRGFSGHWLALYLLPALQLLYYDGRRRMDGRPE